MRVKARMTAIWRSARTGGQRVAGVTRRATHAHGAGRRMSRNQAKKDFSLPDLIRQTQGVLCRKDHGVLDEIPGAYKDIERVMADQTDLVDIVHTLKQVVCVKG